METVFLTISSLAFAIISVYQEVQTGEPALRGLVHAGIGGLFVFLLHTKPRGTIAPLFSAFGMAIGAQAAWLANRSALATVLAAAAVETLRVANAFPGIGAYIAIGMARSIPTPYSAVETMTFVFHSAFAGSVCDTTGVVQAIVSATLAVRAQDSPVALLLAFACLRSCWSAWRRTPDEDDSKIVTVHVAGDRPYVVSAAFYSGALFTDAWTCCTCDTFTTSTRMLHVTAVGASLLYLIPSACDAFPWLKWPLTAFPLVDAVLCIYRVLAIPSLAALYPRALGAFAVAISMHTTPKNTDALVATTTRSWRSDIINRAAIGIYAIVHIAQALQPARVENALAMIFHYIIIILSLAWMGIEDMDRISNQYARAFLATECVTSLGLLVLADHDQPWMALSAACAAFLGWRVHAERLRAIMWYDSSLLSIVRDPPMSVSPVVVEAL